MNNLLVCKLDKTDPNVLTLTLDNEIVQDLIDKTLFEDKEYSGNLEFSLDKRGDERRERSNNRGKGHIVKGNVIGLKSGGTSSVSVSKGFINFHTHPRDCYKGEKTNWGWPSGDDMRECIRFAFSGTICHVVFALEGAYTVQVNPCMIQILNNFDDKKKPEDKEAKITKITKFINDLLKRPETPKNLKYEVDEDYVRGMIISLIENYFKATHGHRCWEENFKLEEMGKGICTPQDWVTFANKFKFNCMISTKNTCSESLPCARVPTEKGQTISLGEYMKNYEYEHWDYDVTGESGDQDNGNDFHRFLATQPEIIQKIYEEFNPKCNYSYGNEVWEGGQWFNVKFFPNKFSVDGKNMNIQQLISHFQRISKKSLSQSLHDYFKKLKEGLVFADVPLVIQSKPKIDSKGAFGFRSGKRISEWMKIR